MAFSRLFGKRKEASSPTTDHLETTEKDDAVIVSGTPATASQLYPSVRQAPVTPDLTGLPYQLPGRAGPSVAQEQLQALSIRQDSGGWTPLQGIHFTLNNRLTGDKDLENVRITLDSVSSKLNSLDIDSLEYNFALEKSILSS